MKINIKLILCISVFFLLLAGTASANKSSVTIDAPESVTKGTEVTIKLNVKHDGNNMFHHSEWVYLKINGQEIARWDFSMFNRPETENFTEEVKYTVNEPVQIEAEASCNVHGSTGLKNAAINVK
ncbi:MAG: desulfoferrodoxin family protein [Pseudomonadota bacterium]